MSNLDTMWVEKEKGKKGGHLILTWLSLLFPMPLLAITDRKKYYLIHVQNKPRLNQSQQF